MNFHVLIEYPVKLPETLEIAQQFGSCEVVYHRLGYRHSVIGLHAVLQGEASAIRAWVRTLPHVWVGNGVPMMESFNCCRWNNTYEDDEKNGLRPIENESELPTTPLRFPSFSNAEVIEQVCMPVLRSKSKSSPSVSLKSARRNIRKYSKQQMWGV